MLPLRGSVEAVEIALRLASVEGNFCPGSLFPHFSLAHGVLCRPVARSIAASVNVGSFGRPELLFLAKGGQILHLFFEASLRPHASSPPGQRREH